MEYTDGNCKYKVKKIGADSGVLPGTILAFSGNFSDGYPIDKATGNADTTWHLCDGTNGTPDLRGRFILGLLMLMRLEALEGKNLQGFLWITFHHIASLEQLVGMETIITI